MGSKVQFIVVNLDLVTFCANVICQIVCKDGLKFALTDDYNRSISSTEC